MSRIALALFFLVAAPLSSFAKETVTVDEALDQAEKLLDNGGSPTDISASLHHTRGLTKDEQRRLEIIDGRSALLSGSYDKSEKTFGKLSKAAPDDTRLTEFFARALDGNGKGDAAFPLFQKLAQKDALVDGDSYWALAQLADKLDPPHALEYARAALTHPIQQQSDVLDKAIQSFISDHTKLAPKK